MKKRSALGRLISVLTICLIMLIFTAGLLTTLFRPKDAIEYENRPAEKLHALTPASYLDGSFQSSMDRALSDQVNMATYAKKLYNILNYSSARPIIAKLQESGGYVPYKNLCFLNDLIVQKPVSVYKEHIRLEQRAAELNEYISAVPGLDVYVYYIEHDIDIDFEKNEKMGCFEYLSKLLTLDESHIGHLAVNNYEEYSKYFLKTDHHWNGSGAYLALCDTCEMMGVKTPERIREAVIHDRYRGTRAAGIEGFPAEDFTVNVYDFPPMTIRAYGMELPDYGLISQFAAGEVNSFSYGTVFGQDVGELIFDSGCGDDNLLVLGDSYDNALVKAYACSFNKVYSVDLRAFSADTGYEFDFASYVAENEISKVLIIGALEYFNGSSL